MAGLCAKLQEQIHTDLFDEDDEFCGFGTSPHPPTVADINFHFAGIWFLFPDVCLCCELATTDEHIEFSRLRIFTAEAFLRLILKFFHTYST